MVNCDKEIVQIVRRYRENLDIQAEKVVKLLISGSLHIAAAESCTGGMLSELITSVSGASKIFEVGICTYSDSMKHRMLGVPYEELEKFGAVSSQVAVSMTRGLKRISNADICVSVTGYADPCGASSKMPAGTVYTAFSYKDKEFSKLLKLYGDDDRNREIIRLHAALCVFETVEQLLMEEVQ